jgi:flagellar assembly protein FliH
VKLNAPLIGVRLHPDARAEKEMEERMRARYEQGVRDGEKHLSEQLLRQRAEFLELQKGVLTSLGNALAETRRECEAALIDLALEAARKLACGMEVNRDMLENLVREALSQIESTHSATVLLNPRDLELLQKINAPEEMAKTRQAKLEFKPSADVGIGGCMVKTHFGTLDSRAETRFELLKRSLSS